MMIRVLEVKTPVSRTVVDLRWIYGVKSTAVNLRLERSPCPGFESWRWRFFKCLFKSRISTHIGSARDWIVAKMQLYIPKRNPTCKMVR